MKKWFVACCASAVFAAGTAFADPPAEAPAAEAPVVEEATASDEATEAPAAEEAAPVDCEKLEGDEKTKCTEAKAKAEAEAAPAAEEPTKGGKAQRSNKNRMESEYTDE